MTGITILKDKFLDSLHMPKDVVQSEGFAASTLATQYYNQAFDFVLDAVMNIRRVNCPFLIITILILYYKERHWKNGT